MSAKACKSVTGTLPGRASLVALALLMALICTLAFPSDHEQTVKTINIGVISPLTGSRSSQTGAAHESSIKWFFEQNRYVNVGDTQVGINVFYEDDKSSALEAAQIAARLVEEESVVAILGPVNSSSTRAVLERIGGDVPVISAWSTAPDLASFVEAETAAETPPAFARSESPPRRNRNEAFFRMIFNDAARMGQYANWIEALKQELPDERYLFLFEGDTYGEGLKTSLENRFHSSLLKIMQWCEISRLPCDANDQLPSEAQNDIRSGEGFSEAFKRVWESQQPENVVLLGTSEGSLAIAEGITQLDKSTHFFMVGSGQELLANAPRGTYLIGDPVLDPARAPTPELTHAWNSLMDGFESYHKKRDDFVPMAYEAAHVLYQALGRALAAEETSSLPPPDEIRQALLTQLSTGSFSSPLQPWRQISFSRGELTQSPTAPIYQIQRGVGRLDEPSKTYWVEISLASRAPFLEGPVIVDLYANPEYLAGEVKLTATDATTGRIVEERPVEFQGRSAREAFHFFEPGNYRFSVNGQNGIRSYPLQATVRLNWRFSYAFSIVGALIGSLLVIGRHQGNKPVRILTGMATGLLLTFTSFYGRSMGSWVPVPSFGSEPAINAFLTGMLGGLVGHAVLSTLFLGWANLLITKSHPEDKPNSA